MQSTRGLSAAVRRGWRNFKKLARARRFLPLTELPDHRRLIIADARPLIGVRVQPLGGGMVFARPGTKDHTTLADVFCEQDDLPPAELPRVPIILDLGCNCGYTIAPYKHLYPDARVVGVEMDEDNFTVAARNVARLDHVDFAKIDFEGEEVHGFDGERRLCRGGTIPRSAGPTRSPAGDCDHDRVGCRAERFTFCQ